MNTGIRHPFDDSLYECDEDGHVVVSTATAQGVFHPDGRWIRGEIRECDPQLAGWVAAYEAGGMASLPTSAS